MKRFFLLLIALTCFLRCTENPFDRDGDGKIYDRHVIQGTLSLNDTSSKDNIYVWLAGTGLSTFTDTRGWFRLQLPTTPDFQGLNGIFGLYYYIGNYKIDSSQVSIRDGLFEFGKYNINENGQIINVPPLRQRLRIQTFCAPAEDVRNIPFRLEVTVRLDAVFEPVFVLTFTDHESLLTSIIFHKKDTAWQESKIFNLSYGKGSGETVQVGIDSIWHGIFFIPANFLETGIYDVIPYIQVPQAGVPEDLLLSFGEDVHELSVDYLKIPFKHESALLQITDPE